ncbi:hypothetical protein Tco_0513965 [Tanacetum coccineum]
MSRRKSKARKGIGLHTSTEPESGEVDIISSKIVKWKILRHGGKGYSHLIRANQRDSCNVHCLNLHNTTTIYMLAERSYPLSEEVCSMMLKKKLFAQNTEVKKKLARIHRIFLDGYGVLVFRIVQALADLKSTKPKAKGIAFREPGKGILVKPEKPLKKKDQLKLDEEIALKLQSEIDEEKRIDRAKEEKINEANIALTE